jgi:hypothetical protein
VGLLQVSSWVNRLLFYTFLAIWVIVPVKEVAGFNMRTPTLDKKIHS